MNNKPEITDAQQSLWDAPALLWNKKSIYQIGVKELCHAAHVARSTFYVYYQNIDELAVEMEEYHLQQINLLNRSVVKMEKNESSYDFYKKTYEYLEDNSLLFQAWIIAFPNDRFIFKWKNEMKEHLRERIGHVRQAPNEDLILEVISSMVINIYTYWLKHPDKVNYEKMDEMIRYNLQLI